MSIGEKRSIRLTTGARLDLDDSFQYYAALSEDLGDQFLDDFNFKASRLETFSGFRTLRDDIRHVLLDRFPYGIYFKIDYEAGEIVIEAIRHGSLKHLPGNP